MKFGLMFFASSEDALIGDKYRLVLESARYGDRHGFSSIWVPERHFTKFGSLYPNPAVLHAALAIATERIRLYAGSVVAPLHNPLRVAEEWSVVDNLSRGRVGISFASGWNPDDFAFFPDRYANRHEEMYKSISAIRRIWRGEALEATSGSGKPIQVRIYPTPVQKELPLWITAAGNPRTYRAAGEMGANLLTHILDQDVEQLAEKISIYREARARAGLDPLAGEVTLMLHTFLGEDAELVREQARRPFCEYIKSNIGLLGGVAQSRGREVDVSQITEEHLDEFVSFLYDRFASTRGLIGTPETSLDLVRQLDRIGVDEIACLLDFGPPDDLILSYLPHLNRLKSLCSAESKAAPVAARSESIFSLSETKARCAEQLDGAEFHSMMRSHGVEIDPAIGFIERVWRRDGEALAELKPHGGASENGGFLIHPAYLDACGRVLAAALPRRLFEQASGDLYLPAGMRAFRLHKAPKGTVWSHAVVRSQALNTPNELTGDISVYDGSENLLFEIEGLKLKRVERQSGEPREHRPQLYDRLLYRREWEPVTLVSQGSIERERQAWLIFCDERGVGERLAALLEQAGHSCMLFRGPERGEHIERVIAEFAAGDNLRVAHLRSIDAAPCEEMTTEALALEQQRSMGSAVHMVQSLAATANGKPIETYFVTQGAVSILSESEPVSVAQAPLWGLAGAVAAEHANLLGGVIDLDPAASVDESARALAAAFSAGAFSAESGERALGVRAGRYYVPRLRPQPLDSYKDPLLFSADATYLITGAFGGLGRRLALWMVDCGARNLCLVSRSACEESAPDFLKELKRRSVNAIVLKADVAREQNLAEALRRAAETMPPLKGVFHLAGMLDDALIVNESWERHANVRAAKVEGAWNLHRLTLNIPLDFFVTFSSAASLLTMPGQASYAMANTFMDALAHYRRSMNLHALSVNWGPWAEAGHAETEYGRQAHAKLKRLGIHQIAPDQGLELLGMLMEGDCTQAAAISVEWAQLLGGDGPLPRAAIFSELVERREPRLDQLEDSRADIIETLAAMPESEHRGFLIDFLSGQVAQTLKLGRDFAIEPRRKLFELGMDSILAIELKNRLERSLKRSFNATLLFMHPTIESLTDYLLKEALRLPGGASVQAASVHASAMAIAEPQPQEAQPSAAISEEQMVELLLREIDAGRR